MTHIHNIIHGNAFNFFIYFVLSCMLKDYMKRLYCFHTYITITHIHTLTNCFLFYNNISLSSVAVLLLQGKRCLVYWIHIGGITAKVESKGSFFIRKARSTSTQIPFWWKLKIPSISKTKPISNGSISFLLSFLHTINLLLVPFNEAQKYSLFYKTDGDQHWTR